MLYLPTILYRLYTWSLFFKSVDLFESMFLSGGKQVEIIASARFVDNPQQIFITKAGAPVIIIAGPQK